jgi:hypothetical protein
MRNAALVIAAAGILGIAGGPAAAQYTPLAQYGNMNRGFGGLGGFGGLSGLGGSSTSSPVLSPYLDIVRGGNPAINYFLGTRSEIDRLNFQGSVLQALPALESYITQPAASGEINQIPTLSQTGHLAAFQAYGTYFGYGVPTRPYYPLNPMQTRGVPR